MKTMTRKRWESYEKLANDLIAVRGSAMATLSGAALRTAISCITPIEDQTPSPDDALIRALGYVPRDPRNAEDHYYCPQCGPFAGSDECGCCTECGATVRDVNPGKENHEDNDKGAVG